MPPPATPSPHRFLASQRRAQSPTKDVRPPSALRKQFVHPDDEHDAPVPQPSQFAAVPRFSSSKSKATAQTPFSPSPPKPAVVQALRASVRPAEQVEDASDENEDAMLDDEQARPLPTIEHDVAEIGSVPRWANDLALSPKRRRLDDNEARPASQQPETPASHILNANKSFTTPASTYVDPTTTQRPAFLRPSAAPQEPSEPLPEAFSPHKRGQKFIPGGMAATVQQWVLETGQAAVQSRKGQGYLKGEDYVARVKIDGLGGVGPFVVSGNLPSGDAVDLLLAGSDSGRSDGSEIHVGNVVGIRAPTWQVEFDGRFWTVGVDWRKLS